MPAHSDELIGWVATECSAKCEGGSSRILLEPVSQFGAEMLAVFAPAADPDEAAFRAELSDALAELPPDQRAVVHLKLWEGLTFEAIAETLDLPPNTAASRYRYGLDKLRERLRPLYEELK